MTNPSARERAIDSFRQRFDTEPDVLVRAPGRVNLIGEHTDYNDGFVLPMALPFEIFIAATSNDDRTVDACSEGFAPSTFDIDDDVDTGAGWSTYVHATATMLVDEGYEVAGWKGCMASDIPAGASLSSSAALEVASGLTFITCAGGTIEPARLARIGQRVENEVMGLPSGIMDQLASAASAPGSASLIDCRDLSISPVELPEGLDVVIMDTGTRRELVDSEYAARREDCEAAAAVLGLDSLRDATADRLAELDDPRLLRRARHVITENERTLAAAAAMRAGDADRIGALMDESHASMRDDYDIVGPAQDLIVRLAREIAGCYGARMTGGGFAGACVALVASDATPAFMAAIEAAYAAPAEQPAAAPAAYYQVRPAPGASVERG